ncbi:MAG: helix-turn-helix transcriptional regulator [Bacteroidaceae bacterium]|nr:helix-turn-helix transcriptional regulator [Bacteroidaceae bacterium]
MNERERIELLMRCYDLSPSQFADKTGIQRASVSHILSGRNKPSLEVMLKIYDAFPGVDMKWLMMGVGEEPVRKESVVQPSVNPVQNSVNVAADTLFPDSPSVPDAESTLFAAAVESSQRVAEEGRQRRVAQQSSLREKASVYPETRAKRSQATRIAQTMAVQREKKIKEIRIYYSDGTYETLVPEKLG